MNRDGGYLVISLLDPELYSKLSKTTYSVLITDTGYNDIFATPIKQGKNIVLTDIVEGGEYAIIITVYQDNTYGVIRKYIGNQTTEMTVDIGPNEYLDLMAFNTGFDLFSNKCGVDINGHGHDGFIIHFVDNKQSNQEAHAKIGDDEYVLPNNLSAEVIRFLNDGSYEISFKGIYKLVSGSPDYTVEYRATIEINKAGEIPSYILKIYN